MQNSREHSICASLNLPLNEPDPVLLGRTLKAFRSRLQIGQRQLGEAVGRDGRFVHAVETGRHRLTRAEFLLIAAALGLDPRTFFASYKIAVLRDFEAIDEWLENLSSPLP